MRCYKKEAIVGIPSEIENLANSLKQRVEDSCYPGKVDVGGDVSDKIIDFLNTCFSLDDFPNIHDELGLFNRITTARKIFDSLSSFEVHWVINGVDISKSDAWIERVNRCYQERRNFKDDVSILLRLDSFGNTIVEYEGTLSIGGTYSKPNNNYGTSLKISMELKFAQMDIDTFHPSVDPHTTNRFSDLELDLNNRALKKEYKKVMHIPFTSLFKVPKSGEYKDLFDSYDDGISPRSIANLVLVATKGQIIGSVVGIDGLAGDGRKVEPWIRKGGYSTKVDIEGLCIYDGRTGSEKLQKRLMTSIKDEVNSVPNADAFLRTEYDISAYLYDSNGVMVYSQIGKLSIIKKSHSYCGKIIWQGDLIEKQQPLPFDLSTERLERDNITLKDLQDEFDNTIKRTTSCSFNIGSNDFNRFALSFIKETKDTLLPDSEKDRFHYTGCLDNNKNVDVFSTSTLLNISEWSDFVEEAESYEYNNHVTEEYVFDFSIMIYLSNKKNKSIPILEYVGDFSVELESKSKTNLRIELKAKKLNTNSDRDYLPKAPVSRYSNLDY